MEIIIIAILGAIISAITGTLWYGDWSPMGRWHMQALGFDKLSEAKTSSAGSLDASEEAFREEKQKLRDEAKPKMWKTYSAQMFLSLLTSLFIGFVTSYSVANGAPASSVFYYLPMIWLCFTVPMIGQNILWGNSEGSLAWKRFFSDSFYNLITFFIIGFVATLFF